MGLLRTPWQACHYLHSQQASFVANKFEPGETDSKPSPAGEFWGLEKGKQSEKLNLAGGWSAEETRFSSLCVNFEGVGLLQFS